MPTDVKDFMKQAQELVNQHESLPDAMLKVNELAQTYIRENTNGLSDSEATQMLADILNQMLGNSVRYRLKNSLLSWGQ